MFFQVNKKCSWTTEGKVANISWREGAHKTDGIWAGVMGFPGGSDGKESTCSEGDPSLIPGLGRSHGEVNGYPPQYSFLKNPRDREAWRATVQRVTKSQTLLKRLSIHSRALRKGSKTAI